MNELDFQSLLVQHTKSQGGYGIKLANRHVAGIPDLLLKIPGLTPVFIECKKGALGLTKLQRITNRDMFRSGLVVGWAVLVRQEGTRYTIHAGADHQANDTMPGVNCDQHEFITKADWRVDEVIRSIERWSDDLR